MFGTRLRRMLAALMVAIAACAGVLVPFSASVAPAAAVPMMSPTEAAAVLPAPQYSGLGAQTPAQRFGSCLAGGGEADLLLLVDESTSLGVTDPDGARVASAGFFLESLAHSAEKSKLPLDVSIATFGHEVTTIRPWTRLDSTSLGDLSADVQELKNRTQGIDTDYWLAFDGARKMFDERQAATPDTERCRGIVLFSDGKLSLEPRGGVTKPYAPGLDMGSPGAVEQATKLAQDDLCRAGGVADQFGSSNTALFGIGLAPEGTPKTEFDLLEAIMTGKGSAGTTCGTTSRGPRGEFTTAADMDEMLFAFDAISNPGKPPLQQSSDVCPSGFCDDKAHGFVLDTATPEVRILATVTSPGLSAELKLPDGTGIPIPAKPAGQAISFEKYGMTGTAVWRSPRTVSIEFAKDKMELALWQGYWRFAFVGGNGTSKSNVHLSGSLKPAWDTRSEAVLRAGESLAGQVFSIARAGGDRFDPKQFLGSMEYSGTIIDGKGAEHPIFATSDLADVGRGHRIDLSEAAVGDGELVLRLDMTTASAQRPDGTKVQGTRLEPSLVMIPVKILAPASYPELGTVTIEPGDAQQGLKGSIPMKGEGCAWIPSGTEVDITSGPAGLGRLLVSSSATGPDHCVSGGEARLGFEIRSEYPATGALSGTIPVSIGAADGSGDEIVVPVEFTAQTHKPVEGWPLWIGTAAALLIGLLVPIAILMAGGVWNARVPAKPFAMLRTRVRFDDGTLRRDGAPLKIHEHEAQDAVPGSHQGVRFIRLGDATIRSRASRMPGMPGFSRVETAQGVRAVPAKLPAALQGQFLLIVRPEFGPGEADLVVFPRAGAKEARLATLVEHITEATPTLLEALETATNRTQSAQDAKGAIVPAAERKESIEVWNTSSSAASSVWNTAKPQSQPTPQPPAAATSPVKESARSPWRTGAHTAAPAAPPAAPSTGEPAATQGPWKQATGWPGTTQQPARQQRPEAPSAAPGTNDRPDAPHIPGWNVPPKNGR